jgi:DNA-directed RNA polymerase specialized sigma24 family protein
MSPGGSITAWLGPLRAGDEAAAQKLWEAYFQRLVALARKKLGAAPGGVADEEDVALSAFDSFCKAAEQGRFPRLEDRDDLWQLLVVLTARKSANLLKREGRQKRGGGRARQEDEDGRELAGLVASGPSPDFAAEAAEECRRLLGLLGDEELRSVALWKMEGHTNEEIAALLNRCLGSVERKLRAIRALWEKELAP